jgi:hypothetical protein
MMKVVYLQLLNGFCAKLVQLFPAWFTDAILQVFDLLELDGEDLRPLPLGQRKKRLARLLSEAAQAAPHAPGGSSGVEAF